MQHRLKLLIWKVAAHALPLQYQVGSSVQANGVSWGNCPLCLSHSETPEHLFLGCSYSAILWQNGPWPLNSYHFTSHPISYWLKFLLDLNNILGSAKEDWQQLLLAVALTIDTIWYARI